MAFTKYKSRKCPVCVGHTPEKVEECNKHLDDILEEVKASGEVPKAIDKRFTTIAHAVGISPYSLQYHLKTCLIDLEIQDQRLLELKDLASALATAKNEYLGFSTMPNATAYTQMLTTFMALAREIEGQQDPEVTVEYLLETVLGPLARRALSTTTEELRGLRDSLLQVVPRNQHSMVRSQINDTIERVGAGLSVSLDTSLKNICNYYKVELEASNRKRVLSGVKAGTPEAPESKSSEAAPAISPDPTQTKLN